MIGFFLHNPIGQQIVAGVSAGLILAAIGIAWAWYWKKRSKIIKLLIQRDQQVQEIHNRIFHDDPEDEQ